jgi:hypothetical protein
MKVIVRAKDNSTAKIPMTGASAGTIAPGSLVSIRCSKTDEWEISEGHEGHEVNANGVPNEIATLGNQTFSYGCIVGSWDGGKTFFPVGTHLDMVACVAKADNSPAELTLYCWDSDFENNSGSIAAEVTTHPL